MANSSGSRGFLSGRLSRSIVAVVAVGLLLFVVMSSLSGFWPFLRGFAWRSEVAVTQGHERAPNLLILNVASCNGDPKVVELRESDDEVRVGVVASSWPFRGGADDCDDNVEVVLQAPLGDRAVIDNSSRKPVSMKRGVTVLGAELRSPDRLVLSVNSCNRDPQLVLREESQFEISVAVVVSEYGYPVDYNKYKI